MEFADNKKNKVLPFTIMVINNRTKKTKSIRFGNNVKTEQELLDLIKKSLNKYEED